MTQIMIECWRTGHTISTGIETDAKTFEGLSDFEAQTYCPYCRRNHRWSKSDACLKMPAPTRRISMRLTHGTE
jgi:hypothetical protein